MTQPKDEKKGAIFNCDVLGCEGHCEDMPSKQSEENHAAEIIKIAYSENPITFINKYLDEHFISKKELREWVEGKNNYNVGQAEDFQNVIVIKKNALLDFINKQ